MIYSRDDRIEREVRRLIHAGWRLQRGGMHAMLVSPRGKRIAIPGTPSDHRTALNWLTRLRRILRVELTYTEQRL